MVRIVLAFAVSGLAYPLVLLLAGGPGAWGGALRVGAVTVGAVLLLGLPGFWFFRCRGWWHPWLFVLGGGIGGVACCLMLVDRTAANALFFCVVFALAGFAHGGLFWLVGVWRNVRLMVPPRYCLPSGESFRTARLTIGRLAGK